MSSLDWIVALFVVSFSCNILLVWLVCRQVKAVSDLIWGESVVSFYFTLFSVSSMVKTIWDYYQTSLLSRSPAAVAHLTISIPGSTLDPSEVRHGPTPKAPEKRVDQTRSFSKVILCIWTRRRKTTLS